MDNLVDLKYIAIILQLKCFIFRWYYTSDIEIREVSIEEVLQSTAYMLFYEKTTNMSVF